MNLASSLTRVIRKPIACVVAFPFILYAGSAVAQQSPSPVPPVMDGDIRT